MRRKKRKPLTQQQLREKYIREDPRLKDKCQKYLFLFDHDDRIDALIIAKKMGMTLAEYVRRAIKYQNEKNQRFLFNKRAV
jgi:hypothetical protein